MWHLQMLTSSLDKRAEAAPCLFLPLDSKLQRLHSKQSGPPSWPKPFSILHSATAERPRGAQGVPSYPHSSAGPSARAQSLFCQHSSAPTQPNPAPTGHQSVLNSNTSKRKTLYNSGGENGRGRASGGQARQDPCCGDTNVKTAREQFIVDQQKKHPHQSQRAQQPPAMAAAIGGATTKSLGANRPRGTFSKFVSTMPRPEDKESGVGSSNAQETQPVDERLKNFEPKIIELIISEIMDDGPPVAWDDIACLEFAKATIKEIVVWPMLRPDIFTGLRGPPKGILLFGGPGHRKNSDWEVHRLPVRGHLLQHQCLISHLEVGGGGRENG